MAKGNTVLKVSGIPLIIFGVLSILFAMWFGFVGALHFEDMGETVITGLLIFYGLFGGFTGFFQIGVGALAIRHSNKAAHWLRCIIWGLVMLAIGVACYILLMDLTGMIRSYAVFYPPWYCFAIVFVGCLILPLIMILGGALNRITHLKEKAEAANIEDAIGEGVYSKENPYDHSYLERSAQAALSSVAYAATPVFNLSAAEKPSSRLEFLKGQRLSRNVDPRISRKFQK